MEVILKEKVGNLGDIGDKVSVKSGFGRNYLIPMGKAVFATADNLVDFEQQRKALEQAAAEKLVLVQDRADQLRKIDKVFIKAVAGEEGRLFGSVGPRDIAEAVTELGIELAKSDVKMPDGVIREIGEYEVQIHLHADVEVAIQVVVSEA
jgi:large subunit ribosomal protein L9